MIQNNDQEAMVSQTAPVSRETASAEAQNDQAILYVGLDLGTSRIAVSCSNGVRDWVGSVIGWPRDTVSARVLGNGPLFGEDALNHRLSLDLVHPLADGNLLFTEQSGSARDKSRKAAVDLLKHSLSLCNVRPGQLIYGVIGAPAEATKENKQAIVDVAKEAGFDAVMVVSEPFSVAYGVEALDDAIIIDIGAGTIDLCRLHGTLPEAEDQITIFKAGNYVDEQIAKLIKESYPEAQFTINMVKKAKERFSGVVKTEDRAIVTFPVDGAPTELDVTEQVKTAVSSLVPEMLKAIQSLVSSFDPEFQHRIRNRVIVGGGGSQIFGLQKALEEGMTKIGGGKVSMVEEPLYAGANGSLKLAGEMPGDYWTDL